MSKVNFNGMEITLLQEAYPAGSDHNGNYWLANGKDDQGNLYEVKWYEFEEIANPEDFSTHCDWENPSDIELLECASELFEELRLQLKEDSFKGYCNHRTEQELIDVLMADIVDPVAIKTEGNKVTYRWAYEFKGYETKNGNPYELTFEYIEEYDEDDNSKIIDVKVLI